MNPSTVLGNKVIMEVQREVPSARIFRRVVAVVHPVGQPDITMRVGIEGQADLYGFVTGRPAVPFEIELKVGKDRERPGQSAWKCLCSKMGIPHLALHAKDKNNFSGAVADAVAFVKSLET